MNLFCLPAQRPTGLLVCMSKESNLKRKRTLVFSYETFYKCLFGYFDDVQSIVLFYAQFIILRDK